MLATPKENPRFAPRTPTTVRVATPIPVIDPVPQADKKPTPPPANETIAPNATKGTRFEFGEAQSITYGPAFNVIDFGLQHSLRRRKVYGWIWVNPSNAADYSAKCLVEFWRNFSKVGELWLSAALSSVAGTVTESVPTCFVGGGAVVGDSIALYVAQPTGTQPNSIILQPQYLQVEADRVTVSVARPFINVTGIRLWLGVISSES